MNAIHLPIIPVPPGLTKTGYCGACSVWTVGARVVAEIHCDTGCGGTVLRCPKCDAAAKRRARRGTRVRPATTSPG